MKTVEKDILMLCKGRYDHKKYQNLEEALDAYYRREYNVSKEDLPVLSYRFMVELWFQKCILRFLTPEGIRVFYWNVFGEESFAERGQKRKESCTEFYEVLYHRLVKWLTLLPVRDADGNWLIDVSEYRGNVI